MPRTRLVIEDNILLEPFHDFGRRLLDVGVVNSLHDVWSCATANDTIAVYLFNMVRILLQPKYLAKQITKSERVWTV